MAIYVVSKSSNRNFALNPDNIVEVCFGGPTPLGDAKSFAHNHTKGTDEPTYVFEVELVHRGSYKTEKQVVFVPAK